MFYQESYNCTMYENNQDLIKSFDYFIGTLTRELAKNITISLVSDKIGSQYELSKQLLLDFEKCGILERRAVITCPNCGQILRSVKESEVIDALEDATYCFECEDENIKVTKSNIFIAFSRIKLFTTSQEEVNNTLLEHNAITEVIPNDGYFFYEADSLSNDDIVNIFYNVNESAIEEIRVKYKGLDGSFDCTTDKGTAYEELIISLFRNIRGIDTTNILKSDTNQIDGFSITYINTVFPSILNIMSPVFYCECKNEPDNPPDITYYQKLQGIIVKAKVAKLGIIFSRKKATKEAIEYGKQIFLINQIAIINIYNNDWDNIIDNNFNALKLIHLKYAEILSHAKQQIDLVSEFKK